MKTTTKNPSNDYVTKTYLNDSLQLVKDDLNHTLQIFRNEINQAIEKQTQDYREVLSDLMLKIGLKFDEQDNRFTQIDKRFEQVDKRFEQVDHQLKQLGRDISESSAMIIDELKTSREEQIILGYRQSTHTDQIKDHDTRISILEENYQISN